ncbi:MAG: hypothetical protein KIT09_09360 [Bryobacteraceae bacterium]|nr:hypothetical protein [Bryobacteraceae bacterium]
MRYASLFLFLAALAYGGSTSGDIPYTVPLEPWDEQLGNHRAVVEVAEGAEAVRVRIPWRRRDIAPEKKAVLIYSARSGKRIENVAAIRIDREAGDLAFRPDLVPGRYFVYYMPLAPRPEKFRLSEKAQYLAPEKSDPAWLERFRIEELPRARVVEMQSRTAWDSFWPMEVAATRAEVSELLARHRGKPYLLFPERREYPIRMSRDLPLRWAREGPKAVLEDKVRRNEFYALQAGVYAVENVAPKETPFTVEFGDLNGPDGSRIPASGMKCFNLGGIDDTGREFQKRWSVAAGRVGALWFGVQVPVDAKPGRHEGIVTLRPANGGTLSFRLALDVLREGYLRAGGVDQPDRLARLQWLDSTIGLGDAITTPYTPLGVAGNSIACLGREVRLAATGFPESVRAGGLELLAEPVTIDIIHGGEPSRWTGGGVTIQRPAPGRAVWQTVNRAGPLEMRVSGTMEFDGGMGFDVKLRAQTPLDASDIALRIKLRKDAAPYVAGMGLDGGHRPARWAWKWDQQPQRWSDQGNNLEYFIWLGGTKAGLYCRLKSPLEDWKNTGAGGVRFEEDASGSVVFRASSGKRTLAAGQELELSFRLLPTPLKPFDRTRWKTRYAHVYRPIDEIKETGATVVNIHHDTLPNLFINYPFFNLDLLAPYVHQAHREGLKVKLYYTVRELTNHLPELWALRSLGDEIYRPKGVGGHGYSHLDAWLQEHLVEDYAPAWITRVPTGEIDASLRTYFSSRWNNFYLEGLRWLLENAQIDGLYLDEIGYPRAMMQRVRRVLDATRPGSMIDLHGNRDWWSCNSPVGYYMEHMPYVDRVWFGEAFNPDSPPDFWLVEMSGIPFGLPGDMLEHPNPWRGMLYGMTARAFYQRNDPAGIWKLWDEFGMEDASMIGYWEPRCPVRTGVEDVLATVYKRSGKSLVALASWAGTTSRVHLKIDWQALELDAGRARLRAPAIVDFQEEAAFAPSDAIPVEPGRGWLLLME